jgi:ATP-dependent Clp protease ATP-binding subunit ClpA
MFERFTDRARNVVVLAQEEARLLDHNYIGTEHVLLGLLREGSGVAAQVLTSGSLSLETARTEVEQLTGRGKSTPAGPVPFTPRAKKILELSLREALEQKKSYIGTEHILLALLREGQGVAAEILVQTVGPESALRQRVIAAANDKDPRNVADVPDVAGSESAATRETIPGWPPGWPPPLESWGRSARVQATAVRELGETLRSINLRLAALDRRLASIQRHLGIAEEPAEADETPAEAEETQAEAEESPADGEDEPEGPEALGGR